MQGIARASRDQASSLDEVTVAVRQMDEMTQHNAALVEETNAAIEQTEAQASELDNIVDIFTFAEAPSRQSDARARAEHAAQRAKPATRSDARAASPARSPTSAKSPASAKSRPAAKTYLSHGAAAIDVDWSEF